MIKKGFILRKMPGMNLVMPTGSNIKDYNGALMLNDTGAFIFEKLSEGKSVEETADLITAEYDISKEKAMQSVENVISRLKEADVIE